MNAVSGWLGTKRQAFVDINWPRVNDGIALWSAGITFVVSWIACTQEYGFLFGFGLGWIPSFMLAAVAGIAMRYLWPVLAVGCIALALLALIDGAF